MHLYGPEVGSRHDWVMYCDRNMDGMLERVLIVDGEKLSIYGESEYSRRPLMEVPFSGSNLTFVQKTFNKGISRGRVSFEWFFKEV